MMIYHQVYEGVFHEGTIVPSPAQGPQDYCNECWLKLSSTQECWLQDMDVSILIVISRNDDTIDPDYTIVCENCGKEIK
jgi:hypothetical protein